MTATILGILWILVVISIQLFNLRAKYEAQVMHDLIIKEKLNEYRDSDQDVNLLWIDDLFNLRK